jgi:hypothetical protein
MSGKLELKVVLGLNSAQKVKALAKGMLKEVSDDLVLPVDEGAVKLLDPKRVYIDNFGMLRIYDRVSVDDEDDLSKEPSIYLSDYGKHVGILSNIVDYIIDNNKTVFDEECIKVLYKLQDEALEKVKEEVMEYREKLRKREEEMRKREEAKEILKDLIEEYEKTINNQRNEIKKLYDKVDRLQRVIKDYAEFIKEKELVQEFINYVKSKDEEEREEEIKEKYMIEEED